MGASTASTSARTGQPCWRADCPRRDRPARWCSRPPSPRRSGPEAVALSLFGAITALAMLVLVGQGLAQVISRSAPDTAVLRALGATRGQAALAAALPAVIAVLGGVALAVAGAVAVSPLAPVGPVRQFDPDRGIGADAL